MGIQVSWLIQERRERQLKDIDINDPNLRDYSEELASNCTIEPRRSKAIVIEIPSSWMISDSGIYLPNDNGRVYRTCLVLKPHPWYFCNEKKQLAKTELQAGDIVACIRLAVKNIVYDSEMQTWISSIRQEDVDAILNYEGKLGE